MAFILLIFFVAVAISSVAAWFSLVGMGTLFAATFWGVVVMAGTLEVGKIVATKWVHSNWRNPAAPWYFRGLFCIFIAALMVITSLGIYGYLSKGHLEQSAPVAGIEIQVAQLETQLNQKQLENDQLQKRMDQISRITDRSLESSGRAGLRAANSQKRESAAIQTRIDENNKVINDINTKLVPLKTENAAVEAKLGPVKYVAELFGLKDPEYAVRIIICIIMVAFDPLALSLFIAGSISLKDWQNERKAKKEEPLVVAEKIGPENFTDRITPEWVEHVNSEEFQAEQAKLEEERDEEFKAKLEEAIAARKTEEVDEDLDQVRVLLEEEAKKIEEQKALMAEDRQALQNAHSQLVDIEARLNDERELLKQWEGQLIQQQEAINAWTPDRDGGPDALDDDPRTPKELIIELLEMNPEIVNDIVQVVESMRKAPPPGL